MTGYERLTLPRGGGLKRLLPAVFFCSAQQAAVRSYPHAAPSNGNFYVFGA
jgi:hypothetical protein